MIHLKDLEHYNWLKRQKATSIMATAKRSSTPCSDFKANETRGCVQCDNEDLSHDSLTDKNVFQVVSDLDKINAEANHRSNERRNKLLGANNLYRFGRLTDTGGGSVSECHSNCDSACDSGSNHDEDIKNSPCQEDEAAYLKALAPYVELPDFMTQRADIFDQIQKLVAHPSITSKYACIYINEKPVGHLALILHYALIDDKTKVLNGPLLSNFLKEEGLFQCKPTCMALDRSKKRRTHLPKAKAITNNMENNRESEKNIIINPAIYKYLK